MPLFSALSYNQSAELAAIGLFWRDKTEGSSCHPPRFVSNFQTFAVGSGPDGYVRQMLRFRKHLMQQLIKLNTVAGTDWTSGSHNNGHVKNQLCFVLMT